MLDYHHNDGRHGDGAVFDRGKEDKGVTDEGADKDGAVVQHPDIAFNRILYSLFVGVCVDHVVCFRPFS